MKVVFCIILMMLPALCFAEDKVFIKDSQYKIITLDNFNEDQFPPQLNQFVDPRDQAIGCMYMDDATGEQFFVIVRDENKKKFNGGCSYGGKNVRMKVNLITTFHRLRVYDFISWGN